MTTRAGAVSVGVGGRVRSAMREAMVTQAQMAKALGVGQAAVSRRINGRTEWKVGELVTTAALLGVNHDALVPEAVAS